MNTSLKVGDYVRHINPTINDGLQMCTIDIMENEKGDILCQCRCVGKDGKERTPSFRNSALVLVREVKID